MAVSYTHLIRPMEPTRLKGIHSMTMMDSLGESNWIPMTRNTRKMADSRAVLTLWVASSVVESSDPVPTATPSGRVRPRTALSMALAAVYLAVSVVVAVSYTHLEITAVQSHIVGQLADGQVLLEMTSDIICCPLYILGSGLPAPAALPPGRAGDPAQKAVQLPQQEKLKMCIRDRYRRRPSSAAASAI